MQPLNGTHRTEYAHTDMPEGAAEPTLRAPKDQPAETFPNGRIITRVWANPTHWGGIAWRVDQYRIDTDGRGTVRYHNAHPKDLNDAMRGLYQAQRWIRRTERRRHRRRFGWW